jgi:hypothetical protein
VTSVLDWPVRPETVVWRVYDNDLNLLGDLMVSEHSTPTITNDTTRSIRRSVPSIEIPARPLVDVNTNHYYAADIDPLSMRARPFWRFGDGVEYPLGVFVWGDDSQVQWSSGSPRTGVLTDLCTILDQPIDNSIGWGEGTLVRGAILEVLDALGFGLSESGVDASTVALGVAVGFVAGRDTFLTVLDGLCKNAGFLPPYFDNSGSLRCRTAPNVATSDADFAYGFGLGGVVPGSAVFSNDLLTAPNRYVAIGGNPDAELVGIFDVPDAAPNSYVNTGRRIRKTDTVQGIATQAQADQAAAALYASDISTFTWLAFDARVSPLHDTWDIVSYDGVNYREVGWSIECRPGGRMSHSLRGTYS